MPEFWKKHRIDEMIWRYLWRAWERIKNEHFLAEIDFDSAEYGLPKGRKSRHLQNVPTEISRIQLMHRQAGHIRSILPLVRRQVIQIFHHLVYLWKYPAPNVHSFGWYHGFTNINLGWLSTSCCFCLYLSLWIIERQELFNGFEQYCTTRCSKSCAVHYIKRQV